MTGSEWHITCDLSDISKPKWTCSMDSDDCRMRMPNDVSDVLGRPLPSARLWFEGIGYRVNFTVDDTSLYFAAAGWKRCIDEFGFKKGMVLTFEFYPSRGPQDFNIIIKKKEKVRSVKSKACLSYGRSKLRKVTSPRIGQGFYVRMTKSYVYRTNATVTIPAAFGWWNYWGDVKTHTVHLQFNQHKHEHVVSVHCYEGSSTKIARG